MSEPFNEEAMLVKAKTRSQDDLRRIRQILTKHYKHVEPDDASTTKWVVAMLLHLHPEEREDPYRRLLSDGIIALRSAGLAEQADAVARLYHETYPPPSHDWLFPVGSHTRVKFGLSWPMTVTKHIIDARTGPVYEFIREGCLYVYGAEYAERMFECVA